MTIKKTADLIACDGARCNADLTGGYDYNCHSVWRSDDGTFVNTGGTVSAPMVSIVSANFCEMHLCNRCLLTALRGALDNVERGLDDDD